MSDLRIVSVASDYHDEWHAPLPRLLVPSLFRKGDSRMTRARRIKNELKALRVECIDNQSNIVLKRIAYEMECAVRYATERTVGWPDMVSMAHAGAQLLQQELKTARGATE